MAIICKAALFDLDDICLIKNGWEKVIKLELWELFDSTGKATGKIIEANTEMPKGLYHKTVSIWIKNRSGQFLMSKRSPNKQFPNYWECTGGSVQVGENTWEAACREVHEELGIDISLLPRKKLISKKRKEQKDFYDAWIVYGEFDICNLKLDSKEVVEARWMTMEQIFMLYAQESLHPLLNYVNSNIFKENINMKKVFLAAPFKSLVNDKTMSMEEAKKNEILSLINFLEKKGYSVHNAHKREAWGKEFMSPEQCTKIDYEEIEKCDIFIAFPGVPASPGTHIEIGWASAFNKKIIFLLEENEGNYAYLVRGLHKVTDVTYIVYHSVEEYYDELNKIL